MNLLVPILSVIAMTVAACLAALGYRFARLPGWRDQRWFWLLAASASLYTAFNVVMTLDVPLWLVRLGSHGNWLSLGLHVIAWNLHSAACFHTKPGRSERALMGVTVAMTLLSTVPGLFLAEGVATHSFMGVVYREPPTTTLAAIAAVSFYAALSVPLWRFVREARSNTEARRYVAGILVLALAGVNDLLASTGRYSLPYLLDLAFLLMVGLVWTVLVERFTTATHRLDMLSTQLEGIVTERTRELHKAHEALAQAERLAAIGRLSAGVAHEINNPSAAVVSNLTYLKSALASGDVPEDAADALEDSLTSMGKIARIVRQLLDTGRVAASDASVRSTFDVALAVEHAVQTARAALGRPLELTIDVPAVFGVGDQLMVEQVLVNLIVNGAPLAAASARPAQRLLIVDDDPIVRESLSRMLSRAFQVETASGVREARRSVSGAHFDAILCDVMMDDGGGEALFSWLQRERPASAARVIFVTGGVTDDAARRFLDGQDQPVLYKPVDLITVERAVDEVNLGSTPSGKHALS